MDDPIPRLSDRCPIFRSWPLPCRSHRAGSVVSFHASGNPRSRFYVRTEIPAVAFEPDQKDERNSIPSGGPACDHALIGPEHAKRYHLALIELKGSHIERAVTQLKATLSAIRSTGIALDSCRAYVVRSGRNDIPSASFQNWQTKFKEMGCRLMNRHSNTPEAAECFPIQSA